MAQPIISKQGGNLNTVVEFFLSLNITIFQTLGSGLLPTKDQYQNIKYVFPFAVSLLQFCKLIDTSSSAYIVVYGV